MSERIIAQTGNNGFFVLDLQTGATIGSFKGASGRPYSISFLGSSPFLSNLATSTHYLAVSDSTQPFIHIVSSDRLEAPCYSHSVPEKLPAIAFTPCGSLCIAGGESGNIYVWHLSSGDLLRCWRGHYKSIQCIGVSPEGSFLITTGDDGVVFCYSMASLLKPCKINEEPVRMHRWASHSMPVVSLSFFYIGQQDLLIGTAGLDRTIHFWRPHYDNPLASYVFPIHIRHISTNPIVMECYVSSIDASIYVLNLEELLDPYTSSLKHINNQTIPVAVQLPLCTPFIGHTGAIFCSSCNGDGSILVSCGEDGIRVWDILSRQTIKHLPTFGDTVTSVHIFTACQKIHSKSSKSRSTEGYQLVPEENYQKNECTFLPPIYPLKRTCTQTLPSSMILTRNKHTLFQEDISLLLSNTHQSFCSGESNLAQDDILSCQRLLQYYPILEAQSFQIGLKQINDNHQEFKDTISDLFDTLCQLPAIHPLTESSSNSKYHIGSPLYSNTLPETPIQPALSACRSNPLSCMIPSESQRLYRYIDRSFAHTSFNKKHSNEQLSFSDNEFEDYNSPTQLKTNKRKHHVASNGDTNVNNNLLNGEKDECLFTNISETEFNEENKNSKTLNHMKSKHNSKQESTTHVKHSVQDRHKKYFKVKRHINGVVLKKRKHMLLKTQQLNTVVSQQKIKKSLNVLQRVPDTIADKGSNKYQVNELNTKQSFKNNNKSILSSSILNKNNQGGHLLSELHPLEKDNCMKNHQSFLSVSCKACPIYSHNDKNTQHQSINLSEDHSNRQTLINPLSFNHQMRPHRSSPVYSRKLKNIRRLNQQVGIGLLNSRKKRRCITQSIS